MLRIDSEQRRVLPTDAGTLSTEEIRERSDLQAFIIASWDAFVGELGLPDLRFISSEVQPHSSCANRIDILAFDVEEGRPVVIELKRERHRLQLLQALSYAGMLSTWETSRFLDALGASEDEDLRNSIQNRDPTQSPEVILLAEYDPEVILTAAWLAADHRVPISCFSLKVFRSAEERHLLIQRDFPVRGIDEIYVARRQAPTQAQSAQSWDDVKSWINFDWGADAIEAMQGGNAASSPARRYFATPYEGAWGGYMLYVHRSEMKVRFHNRRQGDVEYWQERLHGAEVSTWGNADTAQGIAISLPTRKAFDSFVAGLAVVPEADELDEDGELSS